MSGSHRPLGDRLVGIDLARFAALAGMMAAHTLGWLERPAAGVIAVIEGPPSTLFAVLGGVSVALATRARLARGDRGGAVRATLARGLLVSAIGLLVIPLAWAVYVVLVPFGVAIMAAALLVLLPTALLAALAVALAATSGSIVALAGQRLPGLDGQHALPLLLTDPLATLSDVLLTGVYPALTWTTYVTIGILVARALLAGRRRGRERLTLALLGAVGIAMAAAGVLVSELALATLGERAGLDPVAAREVLLANAYGAAPGLEPARQLLATPHSGTPADIARTTGIALVVIAALGLLAASLPPGARRAIEPLRAAGGAPLTVYVVHVVLLSILGGLLAEAAPGLVGGGGALALHVALAMAIGLLLATLGARGPLERVVGAAADRAGGRA